MDIVIDLTPITDFLSLPPSVMAWHFLILFGWIPLAIVFLWGAKELWLYYIQGQWAGTNKFIFLAIDVPKGNEQSPKAVENIFTYLAGAHGSLNLLDIYWDGKFQLGFSLEIVSIEGYTQFIIRTPSQFRNLVESAIYSQYPDAEITEVDDYTEGMPKRFPDEEYDIFGADVIQKEHWVYPIRTYEEFEHTLGEGGVQYKDPMATLMDLCSSLGKGEQLWYQIIIVPQGFDWMGEGHKEISRILGETVEPTKNIVDKIGDTIITLLHDFSEAIYSLWGDIADSAKEEKDNSMLMMNLKPREKKKVEAINKKVSKNGFAVKMRVVYIAKKEAMNKAKVVNGFFGYTKQFTDFDINNFKPDMDYTATSTSYFFKDSRLNKRKTNIINNYMARDAGAGRVPGIMNTEELASLWHFPIESAVKAPLIQKTPGKKADAPMTLPIGEEIVTEDIMEPIFEEEVEVQEKVPFKKEADNKKNDFNKKEEKNDNQEKGAPPSNLPFA